VVKPRVGKVDAIHSYPVPTTKKNVRAFIGLVGWYSTFIPHFSERAAILTDLTKASAPNRVRWNDECQSASVDLFQLFTLQTNASGVGIGAVLLQETEGERCRLLFLSRKLLVRETRYSTVAKECLAMKWAIESLRYYLLGRHFILEMDHHALQWLNWMKDSNMRLTDIEALYSWERGAEM